MPWAIISPPAVKTAVEQSARSLMPGENAVFTSLSQTGTLSSSAFYQGAAAHASTDRIIYNQKAKRLRADVLEHTSLTQIAGRRRPWRDEWYLGTVILTGCGLRSTGRCPGGMSSSMPTEPVKITVQRTDGVDRRQAASTCW